MRKYVLLACVLMGMLTAAFPQSIHRIMFYNIENLFDIKDEPGKKDEEFTPWGEKHWSKNRYIYKLRNIAEAIERTGEGEWPLVVGIAEVENKHVLEDLTFKTRLAAAGYRIIHQDSPDERGIDVALLYRKDYMKLLEQEFLTVNLYKQKTLHTRDILYAKMLMGSDTLHFMVCHFPSMRGGEKQSDWKRLQAAKTLKQKTDSLCLQAVAPAIVIMGDMNSQADGPALKVMCDDFPSGACEDRRLYNLNSYLSDSKHGTYRFRGQWQTIDHIIVSGNLLNGGNKYQIRGRMKIFSAPFLLEEDRRYFGFKPKPTYRGPRYIGGYSDHLPVYIDLRRMRDK